MKKESSIQLINSSCNLGYWAEHEKDFDGFRILEFPHYPLWDKCIRLLRGIGFSVTADPRVKRDHPIISKYHKYGCWKGLEVNMEIFPAGFRFEFFQNINTGDRAPGDGRFSFNKRKLMDYLMGKRFELTVMKLCEAIGCKIDLGDHSRFAEQAIIKNKKGSCHNKGPVNTLDDFQAQMSQYDLSQNNNDRDKKKITCGDMKYFRDYKTGRLMRGWVYHSLNNQWYILINRYLWTCKSSGELFDPTEDDFSRVRIKEGKIPADRQVRIQIEKSLSPGKLKFLLKKHKIAL